MLLKPSEDKSLRTADVSAGVQADYARVAHADFSEVVFDGAYKMLAKRGVPENEAREARGYAQLLRSGDGPRIWRPANLGGAPAAAARRRRGVAARRPRGRAAHAHYVWLYGR